MNYLEATDEMSRVVNSVLVAEGVLAKWEDVPANEMDGETTWAKIFIQHSKGNISALGGVNLLRKFQRDGVILVQVFAPVGQGKLQAMEVAQLVSNAYEDEKGDVLYRNVTVQEIGAEGSFWQALVRIEFEYDDVR